MNNADEPINPQPCQTDENGKLISISEYTGEIGLTKREKFCLTMGVAETGDEELDAIIRKGNEQKLVGLAMQGMLASKYYGDFAGKYEDRETGIAINAVDHAKALLQQLEGGEDE